MPRVDLGEMDFMTEVLSWVAMDLGMPLLAEWVLERWALHE